MVICAQSAFATMSHWNNNYWIALNFSQKLGDNVLSSVTAHIRVYSQSQSQNGPALVKDVPNIPLSTTSTTDNTSFFAITQVQAGSDATTLSIGFPLSQVTVSYSGTYANGGGFPEGPESVVPITLQRTYNSSVDDANLLSSFESALGSLNGSTATLGILLSRSWGD